MVVVVVVVGGGRQETGVAFMLFLFSSKQRGTRGPCELYIIVQALCCLHGDFQTFLHIGALTVHFLILAPAQLCFYRELKILDMVRDLQNHRLQMTISDKSGLNQAGSPCREDELLLTRGQLFLVVAMSTTVLLC